MLPLLQIINKHFPNEIIKERQLLHLTSSGNITSKKRDFKWSKEYPKPVEIIETDKKYLEQIIGLVELKEIS